MREGREELREAAGAHRAAGRRSRDKGPKAQGGGRRGGELRGGGGREEEGEKSSAAWTLPGLQTQPAETLPPSS